MKTKDSIVVFIIAATGIAAAPVAAAADWDAYGTNGADYWLVGASSGGAGGHLVICDPNTNAWVSWPTGGSAPANPLTADGAFKMGDGDDYLRIVHQRRLV